MSQFLISEQFKLEIHWQDVIYDQPGVCRLNGAYFTGPVLQVAEQIKSYDFMLLDLYSQYIALVKGAYVVKFLWDEVIYSEDNSKVFLSNARLEHEQELNSTPNLNPLDYFVIDTRDHETSVHQYNLVYKTFVINSDNTLYRFNK
jgi:hypothetical protein